MTPTPRSSSLRILINVLLRRHCRRKIILIQRPRAYARRPGGNLLSATGTSCLVTAALIALFGLLQITDGVVTYLGLDSFGLAEANPLLLTVAGFLGLGGAIAAVKLCGLAFITFLFFDRHKMGSRWITASLVSADTFYSWVVANNVSLVLAA